MTTPESSRGYLQRKALPEGLTLGLFSWTSDVVEPGRRMYQLHLIHGERAFEQFPTNYENYSLNQVLEMFQTIDSADDFRQIVDRSVKERMSGQPTSIG